MRPVILQAPVRSSRLCNAPTEHSNVLPAVYKLLRLKGLELDCIGERLGCWATWPPGAARRSPTWPPRVLSQCLAARPRRFDQRLPFRPGP
jgi:hypothetical protein